MKTHYILTVKEVNGPSGISDGIEEELNEKFLWLKDKYPDRYMDYFDMRINDICLGISHRLNCEFKIVDNFELVFDFTRRVYHES